MAVDGTWMSMLQVSISSVCERHCCMSADVLQTWQGRHLFRAERSARAACRAQTNTLTSSGSAGGLAGSQDARVLRLRFNGVSCASSASCSPHGAALFCQSGHPRVRDELPRAARRGAPAPPRPGRAVRVEGKGAHRRQAHTGVRQHHRGTATDSHGASSCTMPARDMETLRMF